MTDKSPIGARPSGRRALVPPETRLMTNPETVNVISLSAAAAGQDGV